MKRRDKDVANASSDSRIVKNSSDSSEVDKKPDIWSGKSFGMNQQRCYVLSVLGMVIYYCHFFLQFIFVSGLIQSSYAFPVTDRIRYHSILEIIILALRWINEFYYGKWAAGDIAHHGVFALGMYLGFYQASFVPFAWLLCHMQILHFPMLLWYTGCRRNCISNEPIIQSTCRAVFPVWWMLSTSYRTTIMSISASAALSTRSYAPGVSITIFALILTYLDYQWTQYFFGFDDGCLRRPLSRAAMIALYLFGVAWGWIVYFHL